MDLALNNLERLICYKTQPTKTHSIPVKAHNLVYRKDVPLNLNLVFREDSSCFFRAIVPFQLGMPNHLLRTAQTVI